MVLSLLANPNVYSFLIFIAILAALIIRDRRKVKIEGIAFIRRTQRGREFIDRVARRYSGIWSRLGSAGIVIAIILLIIGSLFMINQTVQVFSGEEGAVRLLLPGPVSEPVDAPGVFFVPWWIWVIGVAVVIIPHEFMHGIMCRIDRVPIKSVGWLLLAVLPGAFVEPDERRLKKASKKTKLRVYAAGSFANMLIALIVFLAFFAVFNAGFSEAGVFVQNIEGFPAHEANLSGIIFDIDGTPVRSAAELQSALSGYDPGDRVTVKSVPSGFIIPAYRARGLETFIPEPVVGVDFDEAETRTVTLAENPDEPGRAFLGVAPSSQAYSGLDPAAYQFFGIIFLWIYLFSFGIGLVNLLPIKPLDGGLILEELLPDREWRSHAVHGISGLMAFLIIFNLVAPSLV